MKRSREKGHTGTSSSGGKKHKALAPPQPPPVVPLDLDFEVNWNVDAFQGRKITPEVRDQGQRPSCGLHVVLEAKEMEEYRACALKGKACHFRLDIRKWIVDFELDAGMSLENFEPNYLTRALTLARDNGLPVQGSTKYMKIAGFKYRESMSFDEAAAILQEGRPIIGGFKYDKYIARLKGNKIYRFNARKFDRRLGQEPGYHVVLFIGYGVKDRAPYLVFLNSWGKVFCQDGVGRIHFLEASHFFTITR